MPKHVSSRRLAPALTACLALLAAAPAVRAEPPPTGEDAIAYLELKRSGNAKLAKELAKAQTDEARTGLLGRLWGRLAPEKQALEARRLEYVRESFGGEGVHPFATARGAVFLVLGPPARIHDEPAHDWSGHVAPDLGDVAGAVRAARAWTAGESLPADQPTTTLSGPAPTRVWVHSIPESPDRVRVVWFADVAGDGRFVVVDSRTAGATERFSDAPARELPPGVFAQVGLGGNFEDLPELSDDVLSVKVLTHAFKAAESKTFVRFTVPVVREDIEIDLEVEPEDYLAGAALWLRVSDGDTPVYQQKRTLEAGLLTDGEDLVAEFGVPLLPGSYSYDLRLVGAGGRGGQDTGSVEAPSFGGALALSSVVIARAAAEGEEALPRAEATEDGEPAPFQVGNYVVRPLVPARFERGDTMAVVVQAYNSRKASLEFDVWFEGQYQGTLEEVVVDRLPATEIQLIPVLEAWPDGKYLIRVTAKAGGAEVVAEAAFRVRG